MSSIAITGGATGTGVFSLLAPSTSTNRTLTLPDSNGTMATAESTLTQFNATGSAPVYACRAWVNFNGTGTVAIRASGNVSSITDNGVGDYTANFSTAMPDVNYCPVIGAAPPFGVTGYISQSWASGSGTEVAPTTSTLRFSLGNTTAYQDSKYVSVSVFR
jgi:hypothetical protein